MVLRKFHAILRPICDATENDQEEYPREEPRVG
jgi:hypothetical protein